MLYQSWLARMVAFITSLEGFSDDCEVTVKMEPPLTPDEFDKLSPTCPLPVQGTARQFFLELAHAKCEYRLTVPSQLANQLSVLEEGYFPFLWGGASFFDLATAIEHATNLPEWADVFEHERFHFKDARLYRYTIPFIAVGNGDLIGFYVRDTPANPSIAYLCLDASGYSRIIAPSLDDFLSAWQMINYLTSEFYTHFTNPRTEFLEPSLYPVKLEMLHSFFRRKIHPNLKSRVFEMSETEWLIGTDPDSMITWLADNNRLDPRKYQLFNCACCRRSWHLMKDYERKIVETAERVATGLASDEDLHFAQTALAGQTYSRTEVAAHECLASSPWPSWRNAWNEIFQGLDGPLLVNEKRSRADLVCHIFGNPFQEVAVPDLHYDSISELARRLYDGQIGADVLQSALEQINEWQLAAHFARPDHPKGCYVLDLLMKGGT